MHYRTAPFLFLLLTLPLAGCVFSSSTNTSTMGTHIGQTTFNQVQPGAEQSFVEALFGPPSNKTQVEGGELWTWTYRKNVQTRTGVIFVLSANNNSETRDSVFVEFQDSKVARIWRES
ncbi:MAG: outer membrane protein assembly factor BamE [Planctomycetota bacterium]|nr:outer membrane protein assembly factor BamE [Planctomycetota bacterium]